MAQGTIKKLTDKGFGFIDDESQLGHGAMTSGSKSGVVAVAPPNQFPAAIWQELVTAGKLKYVGHGLYEMVDS